MVMSVGQIIGWSAAGIAGLIGLSYVTTVSMVATVPSRVMNKTLQTDNIINNYEWFHDANAQWKSRVNQIKEHKIILADADKVEKNRLQIELSAIRQSCRDLATRYNANATKTNRSIFMGREAPTELSMEICDR